MPFAGSTFSNMKICCSLCFLSVYIEYLFECVSLGSGKLIEEMRVLLLCCDVLYTKELII